MDKLITNSRKIDDSTIEITTTPAVVEPIVEVYSDRAALEAKRDAILATWDSQIIELNKTAQYVQDSIDAVNAARQAELDKINSVLGEMDKLCIVAKPKFEPVIEPIGRVEELPIDDIKL